MLEEIPSTAGPENLGDVGSWRARAHQTEGRDGTPTQKKEGKTSLAKAEAEASLLRELGRAG